MKEYAIWAAEQIQKDYPGHDWDFYMYLVTDTNMCERIERYSMEAYMNRR